MRAVVLFVFLTLALVPQVRSASIHDAAKKGDVTALAAALDSTDSEEEAAVISEIRRARWVVFLYLHPDSERPEPQVLVRFLSEMPDLIQDKKTVVFSFNAPYYLDATNISQVTAYYGLYSKQPQFLEIAARLLFQEEKTASMALWS